MPELFIKIAVLIVAHFNHTVLCTKRVAKVITDIVVVNLYHPVNHVFSVKAFYPFVCNRFFVVMSATKHKEDRLKLKMFHSAFF